MSNFGRFRYLEAVPGHSQGRPRGVLVLLHAFPLNARMWEPQLALAEKGWRIVAPQMRGVDGGRDDPPASSVEDYAADLVDLLDALHIETAAILGLSMGGYVALALLRLAPNYIGALILADTRPEADTAEAIEGRKRMRKLLAEQGPQGVSAIAEEMIPKLLGETSRRSRPDVVQRIRSLVAANSAESIAGALDAMMTRPDSRPLLPRLRVPTLLVVGEEDTVTPPPVSAEMQQNIRGSELVVIPAAGHLSSFEQPAAFNDLVAGFLNHRV